MTAGPLVYFVLLLPIIAAQHSNNCKSKDIDKCYSSGSCVEGYYCCLEGDRIMPFTCDITEYFDESTQMCFPKSSCRPATTLAPVKANNDFCASLADGRYPLRPDACSMSYYICANKVASRATCEKKELRFDVVTHSCELKLLVAACANGDTDEPSDAVNIPLGLPSTDGTASSIASSSPASLMRTTAQAGSAANPGRIGIVSCRNHEDGDYPIPDLVCEPQFIRCNNEQSQFLQCNSGMVFDSVSLQCSNPIHVASCNGRTTVAVSGPQLSGQSTVGTPGQLAPVTSAQQVPVQAQDFSCQGKADGNYPDMVQPCNSRYYSCSKGLATEFSCPPPSKYDVDTKQCLLPEQVGACRSKPMDETQRSSTMLLKATTIASLPAGPSKVSECGGRSSGNFQQSSDKCSAKYFTCINGEAVDNSCSSGLIFDDQTSQCKNPQLVTACNGGSASISGSGSAVVGETRDQTPSTPAFAPITGGAATTNDPRDPMCTNKVRGYYGDPRSNCSPVYFSCNGEQSFGAWMLCKGGLFFDAVAGMCNIKQNIPQCFNTQGESATVQPVESLVPQVSAQKQYFNCTNKVKGNYADPSQTCSNRFFTCTGSSPDGVYRECYKKLYYDPVSNRCTLMEMISACSGATNIPTGANEELFTFAPGLADPSSGQLNAFCQNLKMGNYPIPDTKCTRNFYSCTEDKLLFIRWCPFGEFYNSGGNICQPKEMIAECTGVDQNPK